MIQGSCLCGAIAWTASGPFDLMAHCHCSMCRKAHGASFATAVGSPIGAFRFERGADLVVRFDSSQHSVRPSARAAALRRLPARPDELSPLGFASLRGIGARRPAGSVIVRKRHDSRLVPL